jgi:hypothetical protein
MKSKKSMYTQIKEIGRDGMLHFTVRINQDGWIAECEEVTGIITGGKNKNPTQEEIRISIRDAVYSAFDIQTPDTNPFKRRTKTTVDMSNLIRIQSTISI